MKKIDYNSWGSYILGKSRWLWNYIWPIRLDKVWSMYIFVATNQDVLLFKLLIFFGLLLLRHATNQDVLLLATLRYLYKDYHFHILDKKWSIKFSLSVYTKNRQLISWWFVSNIQRWNVKNHLWQSNQIRLKLYFPIVDR